MPWVRWFLGGAFALMFLLSLPTVFNPGKGGVGLQIFSVFLSLAIVAVTVRAARSATVLAYEDHVVARQLLRTRRWRWSEIERFEARTGVVGAMSYRRRVLWVILWAGDARRLTELNCRLLRDGQPTRIDCVSSQLNDLRDRYAR